MSIEKMIAEHPDVVRSGNYNESLGRAVKHAMYCAAICNSCADASIRNQLHQWEKDGFGNLPVCMAKTQYSFTTDPTVLGAPSHHTVPIREVRLAAGAGFIVAICGDIMTMPGLPKVPSAENIRIENGQIEGLF